MTLGEFFDGDMEMTKYKKYNGLLLKPDLTQNPLRQLHTSLSNQFIDCAWNMAFDEISILLYSVVYLSYYSFTQL